MEITLTVSDELATRLHPIEHQLPEILEFGIRELNARNGVTFEGLASLLEKLASLPSPEEGSRLARETLKIPSLPPHSAQDGKH